MSIFQKICLFLFVFISFVSSDEEIASKPVSFHGIGRNGNGWAVSGDLDALYLNPAGLISNLGYQVSMGINDLALGFQPLVTFSHTPQDNLTYAFGYRRDQVLNKTYQSILGGFSVQFFPSLYLGSTVFSHSYGNDYGLEVNFGMQWNIWDFLRIGAGIENSTESPLGDIDTGVRLSRIYRLAMHLQTWSWLGLDYDYKLEDTKSFQSWHNFTVINALGNLNNLKFLSSIQFPQDSLDQSLLGLGFSVETKWANRSIDFRYALSGIELGDFEKDFLHSLNAKVFFGDNEDREPPYVSVKSSLGSFRYSSKVANASVDFILEAKDKMSGVKSWRLVICKTSLGSEPEKILKSFTGKGAPPQIIRWDGRNSAGEILSQGNYAFRLISSDNSGNTASTRWKLLEIKD